MEIALFAPIPPQNTGIADYVFHWLQGMSIDKNMNITVFSNSEADFLLNYPVKSIAEINYNDLAAFDLIIYHIGNHMQYHGYMLDIIKQCGGIIHLHDVVLYHLLVTKVWQEGGLDAFLTMIEKHYGTAKKNQALTRFYADENLWRNDNIADFPLFEEFVQYADACIVHSHYALTKIKTAFPQLNTYSIPQLYQLTANLNKQREHCLQIGVFGGVDSQKKVDLIIKVLASEKLQHYDFKLHIVGAISSPSCDFVHTLPKQLGIEDKVCVHGRVDEKTYSHLFNAADLIIALRYPTMGETSAVVMQALQLHIPVIVTDIGWYTELPDFIDKIAVDNLAQHLENTLLNYFTSARYLDEKIKALKIYAENCLDFQHYIDNYKKILGYQYNLKLNQILYKKFSHLFTDLAIVEDDELLASCLTRIKEIF